MLTTVPGLDLVADQGPLVAATLVDPVADSNGAARNVTVQLLIEQPVSPTEFLLLREGDLRLSHRTPSVLGGGGPPRTRPQRPPGGP